MEPMTLQTAGKAKPFYLDCHDDDNKMHWNNNGVGVVETLFLKMASKLGRLS